MEQEATQEKNPMRVRTNAEREADYLSWFVSYIDERNSWSFTTSNPMNLYEWLLEMGSSVDGPESPSWDGKKNRYDWSTSTITEEEFADYVESLEQEFIIEPQRRREARLWRVSEQAHEDRKKAGVYDVCNHGMPYDTHKTGECGCH
jgi:hypothetical protein|tara:strand:- start:488 stop:928 length:441 start_codon:yes stop_codon:yes gene_type:complete